jgi:hypothetical protein
MEWLFLSLYFKKNNTILLTFQMFKYFIFISFQPIQLKFIFNEKTKYFFFQYLFTLFTQSSVCHALGWKQTKDAK